MAVAPYQAVEKVPDDQFCPRYDVSQSDDEAQDGEDERHTEFPGGDVQLHQP